MGYQEHGNTIHGPQSRSSVVMPEAWHLEIEHALDARSREVHDYPRQWDGTRVEHNAPILWDRYRPSGCGEVPKHAGSVITVDILVFHLEQRRIRCEITVIPRSQEGLVS